MTAPSALQQQGIDISNYTTAKAAGTLLLIKGLAGNYILQQVQYDSTTGKQVAPLVTNVNAGNIADMQASINAQIAVLNAYLAQLAAMQADMLAMP